MRWFTKYTYPVLFIYFLIMFLTIYLDHLIIPSLSVALNVPSWIFQLIMMVISLIPLYIFLEYVKKQQVKYFAYQVEIEKYKLTLENSTIAAYIYSDNAFLYVSPAFAELFGYTRKEIYEKPITIYDLLSEEYHEKVSSNIKGRLDGKKVSSNYQVKAKRKDGVELSLDLYPSLQAYNGKKIVVGSVVNVTEKRRIQNELEKSEKVLSQAQKIAGILYWEFDNVNNKLTWSPPIYELFGLSPDINPTFEYLLSKVHSEDRDTLINSREKEITGENVTNIYRIILGDGSIRTLHSISQCLLDDNGQPIQTIGTMQDITDRLVEENKLELTENRYKSLFDNNLDSVFSLDLEGNIITVNEMAIRTFGYSREEMIQQYPLELIAPEFRNEAEQLFVQVLSGKPQRIQIQAFHKEGRRVDLDVTVMPIIVKSNVTGVYCIAKDVTKQKEHIKTIEQLAYKDHLTGLPNRRKLLELMNSHIQEAKNHGSMMAILYIDLDRLKIINDNLGHEFGDAMIIEAGKRILSCIRDEDTLARVGGDEFVLIVPNIRGIDIAIDIAKRILEAFKPGFYLKEKLFRTTASMGISVYPAHGEDINELLHKADKAMYHVKTRKKNDYKVFENSMQEQEERKFQIQNSIESSLSNGDFFLVYQPRIDVKTGKTSTFESLLRWRHPDLGSISPEEFIPLAEESGDIVLIGEWVLNESMRTLKHLYLIGNTDIRVSVNVSVKQLYQSTLDQAIKTMLQRYKLPPQALELELTESILISDEQRILDILKNLKSLGVRLSIDDFGTGNSSITYLKKLNMDTIKIDRSFVTGVPEAKENAAITSAMINLIHDLGMKVVCEGIETEEELQYIIDNGSDEIQGFYVSHPLVKNDLFQYLQKEAVKGTMQQYQPQTSWEEI